MKDWVECVPNFSEGRRPEVVDALAAAVRAVPGVCLLDYESDASHNRSVFSLAGPPAAVLEAAFAAVRTARDRIDLNQHRGEHPRVGATDVVPFIPLGETSMETCVGLARRLGERIWKQLGIPVYFYEEAATRPERRNLADLRKGEFEGLREEVRTNPDRRPDFGEAVLHPTAGATVVGARSFLVAYNVYLNTAEVRIAREIAKAARFAGGGFRYVKALGFAIEERSQVQVSMNLVNYRGTPIHRALEFIRREAQRYGVAVTSSEIVGLVPREALEMASDFYLQLEGFSPAQILENKIAVAVAEAAPQTTTLASFLEDLSSEKPTPGGGSVAALAGALAAALGVMVSNLTLGKEKFKQAHDAIQPHVEPLTEARGKLLRLIEQDAEAYEQVVASYKLAKTSEEEKTARKAAIDKALLRATEIPLETARLAAGVLEALHALRELINPNAVSDLGVGAQLAVAAGKGGIFNVRINLGGLPDGDFKRASSEEAGTLWARLESGGAEVEKFLLSKLEAED